MLILLRGSVVLALTAMCVLVCASSSSPKGRSSDEQQVAAERTKAMVALVQLLGEKEAANYRVLWDGCGRADCRNAHIGERGVTFSKAELNPTLGVARDTQVMCGGDYAKPWFCYGKSTTALLTVNGEKHEVYLRGPVTDVDLVSVASYARSGCFEQALASLPRDRSYLAQPKDVLGLPFLELESRNGLVAGFGQSKVDILVWVQPTSEICGFELKGIGPRVY